MAEMSRLTEDTPEARPSRTVVAVALAHKGRLCLLRRSRLVGSDSGRWHCVTGYVEPGTSVLEQAFVELWEETGLGPEQLLSLRDGDPLTLADANGSAWTVHPFLAICSTERLRLNWEHDTYRWVDQSAIPGPNQVRWLPHVIAALPIAATQDPIAENPITSSRPETRCRTSTYHHGWRPAAARKNAAA